MKSKRFSFGLMGLCVVLLMGMSLKADELPQDERALQNLPQHRQDLIKRKSAAQNPDREKSQNLPRFDRMKAYEEARAKKLEELRQNPRVPKGDDIPIFYETQKIIASDWDYDDRYGASVAIDGNIMVTGAFSEIFAGNNPGKIYIYQKDNQGIWYEVTQFSGVNQANDYYGYSVAIDGDTIVVGASREFDGLSTGAVYVYTKDTQGNWYEKQKIINEDFHSFEFGTSLDIEGDTLVVASSYAVYLYAWDAVLDQWTEKQKLEGSDENNHPAFSVALDGDTLVTAGSDTYGRDDFILTYQLQGEIWVLGQIILMDGLFSSGPHSVALDGDNLVAYRDEIDTPAVYRRINGVWHEEPPVHIGPINSADIDGDLMVVGYAPDGPHKGVVHVYEYQRGSWREVLDLIPSDYGGVKFGESVAICRLDIMVGDPRDFGDAGAVYYKNLSPSVINQPPGVNSYIACDLYGVAGGCGYTCAGDFYTPYNRTGKGAILPHSGQELMDVTDLEIKGRDHATNINIKRRHMTRVNHEDSPFGPGWAFNYHHFFTELDIGGNLQMCSFGRCEEFVLVESNVWEGSTGRFDRLTLTGNKAILRMPGGTLLEFHTETESGFLVGHLTQITSPNSNNIIFNYDASGPLLERKLRSLTDSFGRLIDFFYEDPQYLSAVSRIRDFSGREVLYDYDTQGRLLKVTSPKITTTGGLNDFPNGKITQYTHIADGSEDLDYALASVIYPNQQPAGRETRLEWTYSIGLGKSYVETHTIGNPDAPGTLAAGGTYSYTYIPFETNGDTNEIAMMATATDRRGTITELQFNEQGQLLEENIQTTLDIRPNEPSEYTRDFTFNDEGDMTQSLLPLGTTSNRLIADPNKVPRNSQGNEIARQDPVDPRGGDQNQIQTQTFYDPIFNKTFKVIDPRGFEPGNDPDDFITYYYIDYMEDLNAAKASFASLLGLSQSELQTLFDDAGITDAPATNTDINGDGNQTQQCGNVIAIVHPTVNLPAQATRVGLSLTQNARETYRFNDFGQLTYEKDTEENVTTYEYFGAADPSGLFSGIDPNGGGYLARVIRDAESASGRNSGHNPTPVMQTTTYEYKAQDTFPENLRGVPTAIIDPRGVKTTYLVNELDQVIKEVRAADVSDSPKPSLVAYQYEKITLYDANNNVIETQIQNKDTLSGDDDFVRVTYVYDILDQLVEETYDFGQGPDNLNITNQYKYDASQNLIQKIRGVGSAAESIEQWVYDERDIVYRHARGVGTPEESIMTTEIDDNGNITQWIDADQGDITETKFDGFDRRKEMVDKLGNREVYTYDSAGNVIGAEHYGPVDHNNPGEILLAQSFTQYDQRNRAYRVDRALNHYPGKEVGQLDDGALDPGDGLVSSITILDRLGRTVGSVDADDDTFETRYDGLSRVIQTLDPLGNEAFHTYDPNNNLIEIKEVETSPLIENPEEFISSYKYDSLNRKTLAVEPNGQETSYQYDSRDNLIKITDQLGNETDFFPDRLDRLVEKRLYLSADGTNASASNVDPSQGGGDGIITHKQIWDELHRLTVRRDDANQLTVCSYDDLDRKIRCDYHDGTYETWGYNADSELQSHRYPNSSVETWTYDAEGRPTRVDITNTDPSIMGTTLKTWGYDGLDRVTQTTNNNDPSAPSDDVEYTFLYDTLSRVIRETQSIRSLSAQNIDFEWQGQSRKVSCTYSNGRKINYLYDSLDRMEEINEDADGSLIASLSYVGPSRDVLCLYGNGAQLSKLNEEGTQSISGTRPGYDSNRRHLRHEWRTDLGTQIISYVSSYNGPGGVGTNARQEEQREHLDRGDLYTLDSAYRLTQFDRDAELIGGVLTPIAGQESTWSLDGVNNWLSYTQQTVDRQPMLDVAGGVNEYSSFDGQALKYDDSGNLIDDGQRFYSYDYQNRLVEIRGRASHQLVKYLYDAQNRRILKDQGLEKTRFLYDNWTACEEIDISDNPLRQYVTRGGLDELVQFKDYTQVGEPVYYYHTNVQGSVGALTDSLQNVSYYVEYDSFGEPRFLDTAKQEIPEEPLGNPMLWQGRRLDGETGFYYYRNRYYDSVRGRFISADPLGNWHDSYNFGNRYTFVGNRPWDLSDPMGLKAGNCAKDISECENAKPTNDINVCFVHEGVTMKAFGFTWDAACVCRCAGSSDWDRYVRGCLACADGTDASTEKAHEKCYGWADEKYGFWGGVLSRVDIGLTCLYCIEF